MTSPEFARARDALLTALRTPSSTTEELEQVGFLLGVDGGSIDLLIRRAEAGEDVGSPLAGGPAKIKHVDRSLVDRMPGFPNLMTLEADWIGTTTKLYYVTPRLGSALSWTWKGEIAGIEAGRRRWKFGRVRVTTPDGAFDVETAASLVDFMVAMSERFTHGDAA